MDEGCDDQFRGSHLRVGDQVSVRDEATPMEEVKALDIMTKPVLPPPSNDQLITQSVAEEQVTCALLKFMCINSSSDDEDLIRDPGPQIFFERVRQYGIPSGLLQGDSLHRVYSKSIMHIKDEVCQYMSMVRESWKITGCTSMLFKLDKKNGNEDKYLFAFYCPKGFIFAEASDTFSRDAMRSHSPGLDIVGVTHFMHHQHRYGWSGDESSEWFTCLRLRILAACNDICKGSVWAQPLIDKAEEIHLRLAKWSLCKWFYNTLNKKGFKEFACGEEDASPVSCFLSVMLLEDDLRLRLLHHFLHEESGHTRGDEIREILDDDKFWVEGRELKRALTHILKIPDLMDTLVPAAGYVQIAIDMVIHTLSSDDLRLMPNDSFWHGLHHLNRAVDVDKRLAAYLNPVCFLLKDQSGDLKDDVTSTLVHLVREVEREEIVEQLQRYHDNCSNLFGGRNDHPVKLWAQYGHGLPLLRKYAIRVLSQPASCMWNQLKKHIYELDGADDYLLRLSVRMMIEFRNLGEDIYKPINLKELKRSDR